MICDLTEGLANAVVLNGGTLTLAGDLCLCTDDSAVPKTEEITLTLEDNGEISIAGIFTKQQQPTINVKK